MINNPKKEEEASSDKTQAAVPSLSLPKGGGAIRGIGEKFAANPVTGTGSLTVPIFTSPGRSGFGPQLSLSYDSGSGNGPFGFGWSLALPSITRKTDKGLPKYQDAEESDVFILSGAEDLVPVFNKDRDGNWIRNSKGNLIFDEEERDGYLVRRYRPRIEGLFARIERWTNNQTGEVHWRSISRENITTIYGKTDNSRIAEPTDDPADKFRVFSWLICESYDDKGNAIFYKYEEEDSTRVDTSQVHEKNRSETIRSANRYIKRIFYGNRTPHQPDEELSQRTDWLFEVVFDYGEHDSDAPTTQKVKSWGIRQDAFSVYRAGFEVRTYRLCQRVLMFHHFPEELGTEDYLVRSTDFRYNESPIASFITGITQSGYVRKEDGTYLKKSLPPLEFEYSQATIQEEIEKIDAESLENLPVGLDGVSYQWVDLDGEGISGILTEQADAWFYKPNEGGGKFGPLQLLADKPSLADLNSGRQHLMDLAGDGQLDLVELSGPVPGFYERTHDQHWERFIPFDSLPNLDWNDPNLKFLDLTGDGHADIMITEEDVFTWHPSLAEQGFGPSLNVYKPYDEEMGPRLIFADGTQSIYLADLSGDGLTDLVRIRNGEVCYWPNLGYGRFGAKVTMDNAPWFDRHDQFNQQRIRLADIDGSGTTDIIYLGRDGVHLYFNQSGNSWSEARTLTQFPHIDNLTAVTVADLKGNGTACIVWSSPLPRDAGLQMQYIDLMGGQKPHLLVGVENNLGAETKVQYAPSTRFYLDDKEAGKPWISRIPFPVHVVERVETHDRISGNCFVTRYEYHHGYFDGEEREFRGFGMVEQWDTEKFGTLNASDACPSATNVDEASHVPPVWTKTWFHTGAYLDGSRISKQFAREYYRERDPILEEEEHAEEEFQAMLLSDTVLPPEDLTAEETHEACRSLKGGILRQEIYALDRRPDGTLTEESDRPYSVSERNYTIKRLQPRGDNKHAVFFVHPCETIDYHYERKLLEVDGKKLADPRVSHQITLNVDEFGNVERSVAIGYPRRAVPDRQDEQTETYITLTVNRFINSPELPIKFPECYSPEDPNWYRTGLPAETQTYEIVNPPEPAVSATSAALLKFEDIRALTEGLFPLNQDEPDTSKTHPYEKWNWRKDTSTPRESKLRLIERVRTLYRKNDLTGLLPLGCADSLALPGETYKLAFTPDLLKTVYQRKREGEATEENLLPDSSAVLESTAPDGGGYVDLDGNEHWWIPSGRIYYWPNTADDPPRERDFARKHFFLPQRFSDPFDNNTIVFYDSSESDPERNYNLLLKETHDALGNTVTVENDYRVLQPKLITDPNGNRSAAAFDVLGMVGGTAVMGKAQEPDGKPKGDFLDEFEADITLSDIQAFVADPRDTAANLLKGATTRIIYDIDRFWRCGQPPFAATLMRERHAKDPEGDHSPIQINMTYSDGFGREVQTKLQAERGDAPQREPDEILPRGDIKPGKLVLENGKPKQAHTDHRWVGKGRTVYNNKGKPVKQYEPYFSSTHLYEEEPEMTDTGVTPVLFYDPVERVVATLHPNNTYEKVVFDPWDQKTYDVNDTVIDDPRTDTDVSGYVAKYFKQVAPQPNDWKTWLQQRGIDPLAPPQDLPGLDPEKKAAVRTLIHADTPTTAFFDSLGRTFLTIAHNKFERRRNGDVTIIEGKYRTRVVLDIEGNQREVMDERKNDQGKLEERVVMRYDYDMLSNRIHQASMEAGARWTLNDVTGKPIRAWDCRGHAFTIEYDALRRPTQMFVEGTDLVHSDLRTVGNRILYEKVVYGEDYAGGRAAAAEQNLLTRVWKQFDSAGMVINETYDFKGNLLLSSRRLVRDYKTAPDWETFPEPEDMPDDWEEELFKSSTRYDALNRPIQLVAPHVGSETDVIQPGYNEANLLERLDIWLKHAGEPAELLAPDTANQRVVTNIDYNARGQRTLIQYGNGVQTTYEYDDMTFRLTHLQTLRGAEQLQDLSYTYDPIGNIIAIRDDAQQTIYFDGEVVRPEAEYKYDALYRLIESHGREHIGQASIPHTTWNDRDRVNLAHPHDGQKMRNYFETYEYDEAGNILKFDHKDRDINWVRAYEYNEDSLIELGKKSNRLSYTVVHPDSQEPIREPYSYDAHGNMTSMPHLPVMAWNFEDQLQWVKKRKDSDECKGCIVYFTYDAGGQRVRKVVEQDGKLLNERIYIGGFEVYRKYNGSDATLERETLHVMDDQKRIALVEMRTKGQDEFEETLIRYQLSNHLESVLLELDSAAILITYEEYYPYGGTSYQAKNAQIRAAAKRYRYSGKERDEENGFYYYGARYYAPWLARWISTDPAGFIDGLDLYGYTRGNPIALRDRNGMAGSASFYYDIDHFQPQAKFPQLANKASNLGFLMADENRRKGAREFSKLPKLRKPISLTQASQAGKKEYFTAVSETLGGRTFSEVQELNKLWQIASNKETNKYATSQKNFRELIATSNLSEAVAVREAFAYAGIDIIQKGESFRFRLRNESYGGDRQGLH